MSWQDQAACKDRPDLSWFPDPTDYGNGGSGGQPKEYRDAVNAAIRVCESCPVLEECAKHAQDNHELGIWGGVNRTPSRSPKGPKPIEHGTPGGYRTHQRRGEAPCRVCADAQRAYRTEYAERNRLASAAWREAKAVEKAERVRKMLGKTA